MAALQQGNQDVEQLAQLRVKNPAAADRIANRIVSAVILDYKNQNLQAQFSRVPSDYHQARRGLLEARAKP